MTPPVVSAVIELAAAAAWGALVGRAAAVAVSRTLAGLGAAPAGLGRRETTVGVLGLAVAAAALWWWEVRLGGQLPRALAGAADPQSTLAWRWAGHVALLGLLAAATWIDLRERVIPDLITVPGVLAGLAWAVLWPDGLLPVARLVPRSFAPPLVEADVLGLGGPLHGTGLPAWLGAAPAVAGLAVASALFVAWWRACLVTPEDPPGRGPVAFDVRAAVLAAGLAGIAAAWWRGGGHWPALLSALVGLATGIAVVWTTRIGASRALGREAVGFGDVTLMAAVGAWLGWQGVLLTCAIGVVVGLAHGLALYALSRDNELPFGPALCAGAALVLVLWRPLWERAGPVFERPLEVAAVVAAVIVLTAVTLAAWWRLRGRGGG